ncbi:hypothetical protein [Rugamonas sp. DEMB1]|uniref:hypothetical protein n=1 Tax=Rugamonas sp. DEMB1 TaxID=3039386 RepID=UPI0024479E15|nr:hypothetical protein [Rugamonas sp. DEMB1]WGG48497.1 hypothetical protein QC826_17575 [Rugamonas sp. DEMB1]
MMKKLIASEVATCVSAALFAAVDAVSPLRHLAQADDAALRAAAIFELPLALAYLLILWLVVFPATLRLRKLGAVCAPTAVACSLTLLVAALLHDSAVDRSFIATAAYVLVPMALPWALAGGVFLRLWPSPFIGGADKS